MNEDRPALLATELLRTESTFQRCIDYVDIVGHSSTRNRCVLYTKALACFEIVILLLHSYLLSDDDQPTQGPRVHLQ